MIIIPAVDIKNGSCVRLLQGQKDTATVYSDDPAAMAKKWENQGAETIHVVDLDGAFQQHPQNTAAIIKTVESVNVPVHVGGGIRHEKTIQHYIEIGVDKVIIGTEAIKNPKLVERACKNFPGRIIVGIDARDGLVAIEGWTQSTEIRAMDLAKRFEGYGVAAINFTDIDRDGMLKGPNIEATRRIAEAVSVPVVAAGGVSTIEDIKKLLTLKTVGVTGIITGKALYAGTLILAEAMALAKSGFLPEAGATGHRNTEY
ncbi:MAG: 1-(5-phosphoribosyl)-5-[(5-phosphoribosylamino)methylideneamino]imidazole-4-carboxamide isomerase [Desulfobacterales bacterium]